MKLRLAILSLCLAVLLPALSADSVVEEIVARVNNDIITRSAYQRSRTELLNEDKQKYGAEADEHFSQDEKNILRDLIDQDLMVQRGQDLGITADTEVIKKLDDMRKEMNLPSMDALEKAAREQGISFADFKENLRRQIITQEVISREVGQKMVITHEEEQAYYDAHKQDFEHPEQVRLSEILVSTQSKSAENASEKSPANSAMTEPTPEDLAVARQKADALLQKIKGGASFEDVAKQSSDGPTAAQGGDLGFFQRGQLAKELEDVTFAMKTGDVSNVIQTKQGYIILKVTEHDQPGLPPLKDVETKVEDAIYLQKLQPALRAYLTKLREDAYIDIKPGYVDTAASPNETKPVFVTVSSQAPAKKKKKKHFLLF